MSTVDDPEGNRHTGYQAVEMRLVPGLAIALGIINGVAAVDTLYMKPYKPDQAADDVKFIQNTPARIQAWGDLAELDVVSSLVGLVQLHVESAHR